MVELCSGTFGSTAESSSSIPSTIERPEEYYGQPDMEFQFGKGIRDLLKPKAAIGTQDMENPVQCSGKRDGSQCSEEEIFTGLGMYTAFFLQPTFNVTASCDISEAVVFIILARDRKT